MTRRDPELIRDCLAGDQDAWDALVERYSRLVYSVPRRYGLDEADAADVHQNVFTILFRKLSTLDDHLLLARWLLTTAHRETWRMGKRQAKYSRLEENFADLGSPGEDDLERWERQHLVRRALDELGDPCKSLLTALFLDPAQMNYQAVADSLGMRVGSIGPTRARCFQKLETVLRQMGFEPIGAEAGEGRS